MCPSDPLKFSKELIEERAIFWVGVRYTKARVFFLRLTILSGTLSLVGLQRKEVGGLWVSLLPPVHEVLDREQNRKVVYILFNGSVLLFFRFADESGTMFIVSLMGSSTSWVCFCQWAMFQYVVSVVVLEFSVEIGIEAWRHPINPTEIVGESIALSMLLSVSFSGWCRSAYFSRAADGCIAPSSGLLPVSAVLERSTKTVLCVDDEEVCKGPYELPRRHREKVPLASLPVLFVNDWISEIEMFERESCSMKWEWRRRSDCHINGALA